MGRAPFQPGEAITFAAQSQDGRLAHLKVDLINGVNGQ